MFIFFKKHFFFFIFFKIDESDVAAILLDGFIEYHKTICKNNTCPSKKELIYLLLIFIIIYRELRKQRNLRKFIKIPKTQEKLLIITF